MSAAQIGSGIQGEGIAQVALAGGRIQALLRGGFPHALDDAPINRQLQAAAQPVGEHCRLVEAALALPARRQGNWQQEVGARQAVMKGMLQMARQQQAEQPPQRPLPMVLEAGDQAVHRKRIAPRRFHPAERRRFLQALAAGQAVARQRQGADRALPAQPRQVGIAAGAQRQLGIVRRRAAEQAVRATLQPAGAESPQQRNE
ncbi:hypothetical protein D3C80_1321220 [compost metagenome]